MHVGFSRNVLSSFVVGYLCVVPRSAYHEPVVCCTPTAHADECTAGEQFAATYEMIADHFELDNGVPMPVGVVLSD